MNQQLEQLIDAAIAEEQAGRYPGAEAVINGKKVEARIVHQFRAGNRKTRRPNVMWKVDGKRIKAAEINAAIA